MKISVLSDSRKGNLSDDLAKPDHSRTTINLKQSMDAQQTRQLSSHEPKVSINDPLVSATGSDLTVCPSYLLSPLETIVESLNDYDFEYISFHDIIEAYSVLSTRIRCQAPLILRSEQLLPALAPVKEHAASLAQALKRDIRRVLLDPSQHLRNSPQPYESFYTEIPITDHDIQYARNISTLCHHSLRVLSDIFAFKTLYSLFSVRDLQDLLNDILKIALTTTLSTPNASKTWSLVFWTIGTQTLPPAVLSIKKAEIVMALRQALNGERGLQAKLDSLKAIHSLLKCQPQLFASSLSGFLPAVLPNLASDDVDFRLQAAHALSGLTLAKLRMLASPEFPHQRISNDIHTFVKGQTSPVESSAEELRLPSLLTQAFSSSKGKESIWAVVVLACIIVLSDHFLFLRQTLKFCVNGLKPVLSHRRAEVQALHAPVWQTLVWAFSRLPVDRTWLQPEDHNIPDERIGFRGKAFRMLKQELKSGKGVSLVGALLLPYGGRDADAANVGGVSRALLVVRAMIAGDKQSDPRDGILLLHRLVSAIGAPRSGIGREEEWRDSVTPEPGLFDGALLEGGPDRVKDVVRTLAEVKVDRVRQLSQEELVQHWDVLMEGWIAGVEKSLHAISPLSSRELLDIWQSLLLVKADLTQENGHLTAPSSFAGQIAGIVNRFLIQSTEADVQVRRITTVTKLWGVLKNVYSTSCLPAESILAAVLKVKFSVHDEAVRSAWSQLCADLISVGIPTLLHVIFTGSEREEGLEVTRLLWTVLARTWQEPDEEMHWDELASFLVIPFKAWVMSDGELELWEGTLRSAVSLADLTHIGPTAVVDRILQRMGEKELDALVLFPKGVVALLAHVDLSGCSALPARLLTVVDRMLTANYPPQPEMLAICLESLRLLGQLISSVSAASLVPFLCALEKSICCWIGDEKAAMLGTEHNIIVKDLYCLTLKVLPNLPRSLETLIAISPFLSSAFGRLTPSAIGPLAFNEFWRITYHGIEEYRPLYPDCLKACLLGFADAYGGSIAEGLSYGETQVTGMSTIPDSQPSYHGRDDSRSRFFDPGFGGFSSSPVQHRSPTPTPIKHLSPEPSAKRRKLDRPTALEQLEDYSSFQDEDVSRSKKTDSESRRRTAILPPSLHQSSASFVVPSQEAAVESPFGLSTPRLTPQEPTTTSEEPPSLPHKRSPPLIADLRSKKRRKTESDMNRIDPAVAEDMPRRHSDSQFPGSSLLRPSFPIDPTSSPLSESMTQNTDTRKRKRVLDWVSVSMDVVNTVPRGGESQLSGSGPSTPKRLSTRASTPSSAEYNSWEAGVSMEEIVQLQRETAGSDRVVPETDMEEFDDAGETEAVSDFEVDNILLSPSLRVLARPARQQQQRSQTAPIAIPHHRPTPLRRNQTTSARIDALERAYTVVTNDASQIPVADLVHASGLVNRIQTALNEQLTRRFAGSGSGDKP